MPILSSPHRAKVFIVLMALAIVLVIPATAHLDRSAMAWAESSITASEYNLKLVRIYAAARYIFWPDDNSAQDMPFVVGVIDPDPFKGGLEKLVQTRKLKKRPIRIVLIRKKEDYETCHLIFIPVEAKPEVVNDVMILTSNKPVLIWRDEADPARSTGVALTFVREGKELLIEADAAEFKRRNLVADGQLTSLNLVRMVRHNK